MVEKNKTQFVGKLVSDVEVKHFQSGSKVAECRLGISQGKDKKTDEWKPTIWMDVKAWGEAADKLSAYQKGSRVAITEGKLAAEEWNDRQTGKKRQKVYVLAFDLEDAPESNYSDTQSEPTSAPANVPPALITALQSCDNQHRLDEIRTNAVGRGIPESTVVALPAYVDAVNRINQASVTDFDSIPF